MIIILTGGIAAGKTTIAELFQKAGAHIIDTDIIARELVKPGSPYLQNIVEYFGEDILNKDQSLNRAQLRQRIFESVEDRIWLEDLLHPPIKLIAYQEARESDAEVKVIVVPLLKDRKDYPSDQVISIECDKETQIKRVMARDNIDEALATKIINAQPSAQDREKLADAVFYNNGSLEELTNQMTTSFAKNSPK